MNVMLLNIEERIKDLLEKESNNGKAFSLLFIAKRIDPKNKLSYSDFEMVLRKMEIEGTLFHNDDDTWCLFPHELGFVQCSLSKNQVGEGLINMPDGRKFKLEGAEAATILDGDLVVFKPTNKRSGNRMVADFVKTVKRKNGLVLCEYDEDFAMVGLKTLSTQLGYPIVLESDSVKLNNHDKVLVQIDELTYPGVFKAKFIRKVQENEDVQTLLDTPDIEDYTLEVYKHNYEKAKDEYKYEDYVIKGTLKISKYGEGLVEGPDKKVYYIKKENLHEALNGDVVEIRPSKLKSHGRTISVVEDVIERKDGLIAVEVVQDNKGEMSIVPVSYSFEHKLVLPEDFDKPLVCGDRFLAKIALKPEKNKYELEFVKGLGHKDDPDANIRLIAGEFGIEETFTDEQMAEADAMPDHVLEEEKVGRKDFTKKRVFTIDGARAKDRDDALSIETLENGNYLIGVHIADVTHYVHPGMALWDAIMDRATSVYMADTLIPMLPHILTKGILSLNPGDERLTLSCLIEMSPDGEVVNFDFDECVIKSEIAMVYDDVNEILENNKVPDGYEDYVNDLKTLHGLSRQLSKQRDARGAIDFDDIESDIEIQYDEQGKPIEFLSKGQRSAEKLIENFMLLAGTCYAEYMMIPTTLRVHEEPDPDALKGGIEKLKKLGVRVKSVDDILNPYSLTKIIHSIKDQEIRTLAANIVLSSMKRARIDVDETLGHYALALRKIGRFTSPMRRAEDAIGHWQLKKQKFGRFSEDFEQDVNHDYEWIKEEADHINIKQYNADQAESVAISVKMADYINPRLGQFFSARVTYINETGIFVKLKNGVVGKIDPYDYLEDYLIYDDSTLSYVGRKSGKRVYIGDELIVQALDTKREHRVINFGVSKEEGKKLIKKRVA